MSIEETQLETTTLKSEAPPKGDTGPKLVHRVPLVVVLAVAVFFLLKSYQLSIGSLTEPGPGMWPFVVSLALMLAVVCALIVEKGSYFESFDGGTVLAILGIISLGGFVVLFSHTGMILPGVLFLVFWLRFLGKESWRLSALIAVGSTLAAYFLFVVGLGVIFPDDIIAQLWGGR